LWLAETVGTAGGIEAAIFAAARQFFLEVLRALGYAIAITVTITYPTHGQGPYKPVYRASGGWEEGQGGIFRPSWAETNPAFDPNFGKHYGMVPGDNAATHVTIGLVPLRDEGRTWFRIPAKEYDGKLLKNGYHEILIPDPRRTVKFPTTFRMPNGYGGGMR
jgi:hypothetical protein